MRLPRRQKLDVFRIQFAPERPCVGEHVIDAGMPDARLGRFERRDLTVEPGRLFG